MELERRTCDFQLELRADDDQEKIIGHAAVFNEIGEGRFFKEKIAPGSFLESIKTDDIRALFNHDPNYVLGRNKAKTLKLREDDAGLRVEITPPNTTWAKDIIESIRRGDISQMSFGFETQKEEWDEENNLRTLIKVRLWDVSPVTFPFYEGTDVALRNREEMRKSNKNESWLSQARSRTLKLKQRELELRRK